LARGPTRPRISAPWSIFRAGLPSAAIDHAAANREVAITFANANVGCCSSFSIPQFFFTSRRLTTSAARRQT